MTAGLVRAFSLLAVAAIGGAAFVGCAPSTDTSGNGPTEQSVAVLDEFFDHLEAGEPAEAAALTDINFPTEFVDEAFYSASATIPSDARVIETSGADSHTVTATVEYVLDDPGSPVTATFTVKNTDGERTVSWRGAGDFGLIMVSSPGRIVLNGSLEYPKNVHVSTSSVSVLSLIDPAVITAVEEEITTLTTACAEEQMMGPSCPPAVLECGHTVEDHSTVEWFEDVYAGGLTVADSSVHYSVGFTVRADNETFPIPAVYAGTVTRSEDGTVTYARAN